MIIIIIIQYSNNGNVVMVSKYGNMAVLAIFLSRHIPLRTSTKCLP